MLSLKNLAAVLVAFFVVFSTYFYGYKNGQNSEELKRLTNLNAQLTELVQKYETQQTEQAVSLAELRRAESDARAESDKLRERINSIERRAQTDAARLTVRHLRLEAEGAELLKRAEVFIEYCRKALSR